jgi:hypothetical protein
MFLVEAGKSSHHIVILSDSQAALRALMGIRFSSKCVAECASWLDRLTRSNNVTLCWVKAHIGIMGNEIADRLAKRGADTPWWGPEPIVPIPMASVKSVIRTKIKQGYVRRWGEGTGCRQTRLFFPHLDTKRTEFLWKVSKDRLRIAVHMLTGHNLLNSHLFKMRMREDMLCEYCEEGAETAEHFLLRCKKWEILRRAILGGEIIRSEAAPSIKITRLIGFVKATKRYE